MLDDARTLLAEEGMEEEEQLKFIEELRAELEGKELQERGATLVDILEELQAPREGMDDIGDDYGGDGRPMEGDDDGGSYEARAPPPYEGPEALAELRQQVMEAVGESDARDLEEKLNSSDEHEQWELLWEVRDYLQQLEEEDAKEYEEWEPTAEELEEEWKELLTRVPEEDLASVEADWAKASYDEKKRWVWDVSKILDQEDAEDEEAEAQQQQAPPRHPGPRAPDGEDVEAGKSEVRRRGGKRGGEYEYNYEYDFSKDGADGGGEWEERYAREGKRGRKRSRAVLYFGVGAAVIGAGLLLLIAKLTAEEDESVISASLGLLGLRAAPAADDAAEAAAELAEGEA